MPRSKQPPPRKPVKAKGALPAPVTAPEREDVVWYKQPRNLAIMGAALLFLIVFGVKTGMDLAEASEQREQRIRTVEQFQRRLQLLNADLGPVYEELNQSPGAYLAGALSTEEFQQQANRWVEAFRDLYQGIENTEVPQDMDRLIEAKGLFVQSALVFVDAAKTFALAPAIPDEEQREDALVLARNEFLHGSAILSMAERRFVAAQNELGLNDPEAELPAVQFPSEEEPVLPPSPTPGPGAAPQPAPSPAIGPQEAGPIPSPTIQSEEPQGSPQPQPAG